MGQKIIAGLLYAGAVIGTGYLLHIGAILADASIGVIFVEKE